jgi:hypothetical protein
MTYYEAALQVLGSARQPLTVKEITHRAIAKGLILPQGQTPTATMAAELYRHLGGDDGLVKIGARGETKQGDVKWALREQ